MVTAEATTTNATTMATKAEARTATTETATGRGARHMVATAIVCDPHPADGRPRVLLVWSAGYGAWVFPTAHPIIGESLPQTALRAAANAGVIDAHLLRDTTLEPVPGLLALDSPWRTYQIPAPTHSNTWPGKPPSWHQHLDHVFIALADSHAPLDDMPPLPNGRWWPVADLPTATRPDIPLLAHAASHHATAIVYRPYQRAERMPGGYRYPQDHRGRTHR